MKKILLCLLPFVLLACTDYEADYEDVYGPLVGVWQEQARLQEYINSQSFESGLPIENGETISDIECMEGADVEIPDDYFEYKFKCIGGHWTLMSSVQKNIPTSNSSKVTTSTSKKVSSSSRKVTSSSSRKVSSSSKAITKTTGSCAKAMYCAEANMNKAGFTGQVETGFDDGTGTYGYWFTYTDEGEGGDSYFSWPAGIDDFEGFEANSRDTYGAIKGTFTLGRIMSYGYGGLAFNIGGDDLLGYDISGWGGICVTYTATSAMALEIKVFNEEIVTAYNNPTATLNPVSSKTTVDYSWEDFAQEHWLAETPRVSTSRVISDAAAIAFKFQTSNSFAIYAIGKYGTCN